MLDIGVKRYCTQGQISWLCAYQLTQRQLRLSPSPFQNSRACFASAANAATKEGPDAKKEAKKSAMQTILSAVKVTLITVELSQIVEL